MFPQAWRLTRKRDLDRVYKQGQSAATKSLFIRALPNRLDHPRLTVVIGKKIAKKAVIRNRLKRLIRQSLQELFSEGQEAAKLKRADVVVVMHKDPQPPYELATMKAEVRQCLTRLP